MIKLEKQFKSGAGAINRNYLQLARTDNVALYIRNPLEGERGHPEYEVFYIKVIPKGKRVKLPNKPEYFTADDEESYPCNTDFGRIAWSIPDKKKAFARYEELCNKSEIPEEEEQEQHESVIFPKGEWSTKELAEANKIEYPQAAVFLREAIAAGTIKLSRQERRNAKGKPTNLYIVA